MYTIYIFLKKKLFKANVHIVHFQNPESKK